MNTPEIGRTYAHKLLGGTYLVHDILPAFLNEKWIDKGVVVYSRTHRTGDMRARTVADFAEKFEPRKTDKEFVSAVRGHTVVPEGAAVVESVPVKEAQTSDSLTKDLAKQCVRAQDALAKEREVSLWRRDRIKGLVGELDTVRETAEKERQLRISAEQVATSFRDACHRLKNKRNETKGELAKALWEADDERKSRLAVTALLESRRQECERLRQDIKEARDDVDEAVSGYHKASEHADSYKRERDEAKGELGKVRQEVDDERKLRTVAVEMAETRGRECVRLRQELVECRAKLSVVPDFLRDRVNELTREREAARQECRHLQQELTDCRGTRRQEYDFLQDRIAELTREREEARTVAAEASAEANQHALDLAACLRERFGEQKRLREQITLTVLSNLPGEFIASNPQDIVAETCCGIANKILMLNESPSRRDEPEPSLTKE